MRSKIEKNDESLEDSKSNDEWTDKKVDIKSKDKQKFLKAISKEEKPIESFIIPAHLKSIKENYPNIKDETLKLLSTPEGLKNRKEIVNSLSDEELNPIKKPSLESKITPFGINENIKSEIINLSKIIKKGQNNWNTEDLKLIDETMLKINPDSFINAIESVTDNNELKDDLIRKNLDKNLTNLVDSNIGISKQELIQKLISNNPIHKDFILNYVKESLDFQLGELKEKFGDKTYNKIEKALTKEDIKDLQILSHNRSIENIKIAKNINKTHNKLLNEIKGNTENTVEHYNNTMDLFE